MSTRRRSGILSIKNRKQDGSVWLGSMASERLLRGAHVHQLLFKAVSLDRSPSAALATPASLQQPTVLLPSYAIERTRKNRDD